VKEYQDDQLEHSMVMDNTASTEELTLVLSKWLCVNVQISNYVWEQTPLYSRESLWVWEKFFFALPSWLCMFSGGRGKTGFKMHSTTCR